MFPSILLKFLWFGLALGTLNPHERIRFAFLSDRSPGCRPDVISLNAAISACAKAGWWQLSLETGFLLGHL